MKCNHDSRKCNGSKKRGSDDKKDNKKETMITNKIAKDVVAAKK